MPMSLTQPMCSEGCTAGHCSGAPFLCLECWPSPLTCLSISAEGRKPLGEGMSHWNQFVPGLKQFDGSYIAACSVMDDFFANLEKRVAPFELVPPADLQWHTSDPQHSYPLLPPPTYSTRLQASAQQARRARSFSTIQHDGHAATALNRAADKPKPKPLTVLLLPF